MPTITHAQLQDLIIRLPAAKLPLAHSLLLEMADKEINLLSPRPGLVSLSLKRSSSEPGAINRKCSHVFL
jgi:hypothetical protein